MKKRVCVLLAAMLLACAAPALLARAAYPAERPRVAQGEVIPVGVGNHNSYSSGSHSYSGGSSRGYSGSRSYSGGSSSGGGNFFFLGSMGSPGMVFLIIVVCVVYAIVKYLIKNSGQGGGVEGFAPSAEPEADLFLRPAENVAAKVQAIDPAFSEEAFLAWAREVFITLNDAWEKRDWSVIRPFESEELFREHSRQLQEYIDNGTVNYLDRVAVKDSFLKRFYSDNQYEYLEVKMRTSMIDYVQETETGKIIAGDKTTLWQMVHTLTFMRTKGVLSKKNLAELHVTNCPNCGAPCQVTSAGMCEYCKSVITTGEFNWVLCKFTGENL